ncbi:adenylate cyclase type 9-like isoform X1 [Pollicipes pollicipes]|uniref:adenylate cyclase type 9-like isoform X1 n=2 Tax=Pollicipes pollicipes TaxID=41117 RepID=UPI00188597AF|nr:adenylate cyclase type 9-like isoform X1 [Pollicipes pollicipes]XP_037086582.1 adenylate cyclase type 9-like isoform X1 [Pollicipes pollicipes]
MSSFNSRKDSGIRSRRSSIQAEIGVLNGMRPGDLLSHRVSGYCTSSQSSLAEPSNTEMAPLAVEEADLLGQDPAHLLSMQLMQRKLSDLEMIKCVQQMSSHSNYFINPPIDRLTLFYQDPVFERMYRHQHARRHHSATNALSLPKYNTLVDTAVASLVFAVLATSLLCTFAPRPGWVAFCVLAVLWLLLMQTLIWLRLTSTVTRHADQQPTRFALVYTWYTRWYPFHAVGATLVSLPAGAVFANWSCESFERDWRCGELYFLMLFVGLIHYCNFTQLNCWMKSMLATLSAAVVAVMVYALCDFSHPTTDVGTAPPPAGPQRPGVFPADLVVGMVLLVALVWILNREFEISYRLGFCVNLMAARDKAEVQRLEGQADWLLHQIIPVHVADVIKTKAKYSENHHDVAVVFASIINFNALYDETYHGGREYLRVLNEIIGDMDDLLKKYPSVEKIKTIGSTYMAASGLDPSQRRDANPPDEHLVQLMEFAMDLQKAVDAFNASLFEFEMELRIGYNFGDVTAGVIGTTKLYYDIWGDTVNTASRMDSTGVPGRIQTTQSCAEALDAYFEFERRGEVFVKGKDNMVTYFLKARRSGNTAS